MSAILVVRPSSLGDIVHALTLVADVRAHRPELAIDWVAESRIRSAGRASSRHPAHHSGRAAALAAPPLRASTWREFASFRRALRREEYAAVLDLQEQVKGALIARMARGVRHGPDRASIREPVASLAHDVHHAIDPDQHFIARCRELAAAALGYRVEGPPRFGLVPPPPPAGAAPDRPYRRVLARHVARRQAVARRALAAPGRDLRARRASRSSLPWGSDAERARSERYAAGVADAHVPPPPRLTLPALAGLLARAELAVGVDTGLVHLAAALGTPTVSLFVATDPMRCGVGPAGLTRAIWGASGSMPTPDAVAARGRRS